MDITMLFFLLVIIPSAILHEYMHGWVADQLGDPTARYAGRLTLNPKAHIDPFGSIVLPLIMIILPGNFLFAYAKPVPFNPYNLKNQKWGPAMVAVAGPLSNLFLAVVFGVATWFMPLAQVFKYQLVRAALGGGSLVEVAAGNPIAVLYGLFSVIVYANIILAIFNMVPIPPLDGSKLLYAVLPDSAWQVRKFLEQYGFVVLVVFIFFFFQLLHPIINWLFQLLVFGF